VSSAPQQWDQIEASLLVIAEHLDRVHAQVKDVRMKQAQAWVEASASELSEVRDRIRGLRRVLMHAHQHGLFEELPNDVE